MKTLGLTAALLLAGLAAPATAQDVTVNTGGSLKYLNKPDGAGSSNRVNLTAYLEAERAGFYGGIWGQQSSNSDYNEVDLYLGYRRELDSGLSYDIGYARYFYPTDSASNAGEITVNLGQAIGDKALVAIDVAYDPKNKLGNAYLSGEFYPTDKITISASYGAYQQDAAPTEQEWDFGATYAISDTTAVDLRWFDGTDYTDGYVGLKASFDTTIFGG